MILITSLIILLFLIILAIFIVAVVETCYKGPPLMIYPETSYLYFSNTYNYSLIIKN